MRLVVSKRSDIALRALELLVAHGTVVPGADLCAELEVGLAQLSQVMSALVTAGWVTSRPGPDGGYCLAPRLRKLSVLQVVEMIEGPLASGDCVLAGRACGGGDPCAFHATWTHARESLARSLARESAI